jgi:SurA N-terminal domain
MFGSFRKHQQWIWIVVAAITILSFVVFFSPDAKWKTGSAPKDTSGNWGTIDGKPIGAREYHDSYQETLLSHFLRANGKWPDRDEQTQRTLERDTVVRVFLKHKMNDLDIHVSDAAAANLSEQRIGHYQRATVEKDLLAQQGLTWNDFERFWKHEAGLMQLMNVAASSAKLMNPSEAETLWRKDHQEVASEMAVFNASNYVANVVATPEELGRFYTNRMATYRVPERTVVTYVPFTASNFFAKADERIGKMTNFNAAVDEQYIKRSTNDLVHTADGKVDEAGTKKKIREEIREIIALQEARKSAADFGNELLEKVSKSQPTLQAFTSFAAAKGYTTKTTEPFDRQNGLSDTNFPPEFETRALNLTATEPISYSPILGEKGVYLIALDHKIPSELPGLDKIKDKVTTDYKQFTAANLARSAGEAFYKALTNGLAQKKTFEDVCKQTNAKLVKLPPFSSQTQALPEAESAGVKPDMLKRLALDVNPGHSSKFEPTAEGGLVFYVEKRLPVDEAKMKAELPEFLTRLRLYRQNEAFNQWFRKQAEQAKLQGPQRDTKTASAQ